MKRYLQAVSLGMALCLAANSVWAQAPERIRFARNATSAVVKGVLRGFENVRIKGIGGSNDDHQAIGK